MIYHRKISAEEAVLGKILILKTWWKKLPPPGSTVEARLEGENMPVKIEAVDCTCVGPEKPHQHYYFVLPAHVTLNAKQEVRLEIP